MIELDENSNNILTLNELWGSAYTKYLDSIVGDTESKGYMPPSIDEFLAAFKKIMEDLKKMSKEELKKVGIDSNTIDLSASAEEVFKQIMENPKGAEVLENLKEKLENQDKKSDEVALEDNATFAEIAKLTKLDEETLTYNLQNNSNFEEDIISIVQELTQNVDTMYPNVLKKPQKTLDILA